MSWVRPRGLLLAFSLSILKVPFQALGFLDSRLWNSIGKWETAIVVPQVLVLFPNWPVTIYFSESSSSDSMHLFKLDSSSSEWAWWVLREFQAKLLPGANLSLYFPRETLFSGSTWAVPELQAPPLTQQVQCCRTPDPVLTDSNKQKITKNILLNVCSVGWLERKKEEFLRLNFDWLVTNTHFYPYLGLISSKSWLLFCSGLVERACGLEQKVWF